MVTENCCLQTDGGAIAPPHVGMPAKKKKAFKIVMNDFQSRRERSIENTHNPSILRAKLNELIRYTHIALQQFPKKEKYQLCADIKNSLYQATRLTIQMERRYYKKTTLQDIDIEIDFLRTLVRLSYELKYISVGHLQAWMEQVDEAGKILGGLIKYFSSDK